MIFRSTYPDVDIPDVSLPAFVLKGATALGNKPALIAEGFLQCRKHRVEALGEPAELVVGRGPNAARQVPRRRYVLRC